MKHEIKHNKDLYVDGVRIPCLLLGTSPFIGAGQFGRRAWEYRKRFYDNPGNMAGLIAEATGLGITHVQAFGDAVIANAIEDARKMTGKNIQVVGSIGGQNFGKELEVMRALGAKIIMTHALVTDRLDDIFRKCIDRISEIAVPGAVTHHPGTVIPKLAEFDNVKIVMAAINKTGKYMAPSADKALEAIKETDKIVIGKKTLSAGSLGPREALEYVSKYVYGVAIGVASSKELRETFTTAKEFFKNG
jgi:hypothetical protein